MKLALGLLLVSRVVIAEPVQVIAVEVDEQSLDRSRDDLPWAEAEPGGQVVPDQPHRDWLALGLKAGDLVTRVNGQPVSSSWRIDEGTTYLDVVRAGHPIELRITVRGNALRTVHLSDADIADMLDDKKPPNPTIYAVPVKRGKQVTGVRIIQRVHKLDLDAGDLVRRIGRAPITSDADLIEVVAGLPGGHFDMLVERDGRALSITLEREPPHHR